MSPAEVHSKYCKFRNIRENFIFKNSIKRHIGNVRKSQLGHDIHISVNERVILPFHKGFQGLFLADFIAVIRLYSQHQKVYFFPNFRMKIPNSKLEKLRRKIVVLSSKSWLKTGCVFRVYILEN